MRRAAGGRLSLESELPDWVAVEQVSKGDRVMVHLVNYAHKRTPSIPSEEVRCRLPKGEKVKDVRLYSPNSDAPPLTLKAADSTGEAVFTVPEVKVYAIAAVSW